MTLSPPKLVCREINQADIIATSLLLARRFPKRKQKFWLHVFAELARFAPSGGLPRYGYLLAERDTVVGALLLISTQITSGEGGTYRCNLSSWCVEPDFAPYATLLVSKALRHSGVTYINISPARHTRAIIKAQGFEQYSRGVFVAAPVFQRSGAKAARIFPTGHDVAIHLDPAERRLMDEHAAAGCIAFWCVTSEGAYPFVFRFRTFKGVPSAQLIYCRGIDDFTRFAAPIGRYLARRGRMFVVLDANAPIAGLVGVFFSGVMPKYFRGGVPPRLGDLAYTEAALFGV